MVTVAYLTGDDSLLYRQTIDTFSSSLAPGTYANRSTQAASYIRFALLYNINYLQPSILDVCMYCQYLANNHSSISAVKNYLAGAKTWVSEHMGNPVKFFSPEVSLMMKSIAKKSVSVTKRATPLSKQDITQICTFLDAATNAPPAIKPCVLIGYACFLRGSNLVSPGQGIWGGSHTLLTKDVLLTSNGLIVVISSTKTRVKPYAVKIPYEVTEITCPVRAWVRYKSLVMPPLGGPAFVLSNRTAVNSNLVLSFMKAALSVDPTRDLSKITMHSLRRGAVQNAESEGLSHEQIMDIGGWSSKAGLRPYLRA